MACEWQGQPRVSTRMPLHGFKIHAFLTRLPPSLAHSYSVPRPLCAAAEKKEICTSTSTHQLRTFVASWMPRSPNQRGHLLVHSVVLAFPFLIQFLGLSMCLSARLHAGTCLHECFGVLNASIKLRSHVFFFTVAQFVESILTLEKNAHSRHTRKIPELTSAGQTL